MSSDQNSGELQAAGEGLPESPAGRNDVGEDEGLPVAGRDAERERLAIQVSIGLPVCSPVPRHRQPAGFRSLDGHGLDRSAPTDIRYKDKLKVVATVDGEPYTSVLLAWNPASPTIISISSYLGI